MQLPTIHSEQEALALARKADDFFYCVAYKLQFWLSELSIQANAAYAEHPNPADRHMQSGQAWRSFHPVFAHLKDKAFYHIIGFLVRFSRSDNPISTPLLAALATLYIEHELTGDYLNFEQIPLSPPPPVALVPLMRRSLQRMCDWLDAVIHANMHLMSFREPACFHPDPESRRLASRDISQQYIAQMAAPVLVAPYIAPSGHKHIPSSPPAPAPRTAGGQDPYNQLNQSIITIWPLLKLHNWTYAALWSVLRDCAVPTSPCENYRHLAHYCLHTLGLRKTGSGHTATNSKPAGYSVAPRLLCPPPSRPVPGTAPWS